MALPRALMNPPRQGSGIPERMVQLSDLDPREREALALQVRETLLKEAGEAIRAKADREEIRKIEVEAINRYREAVRRRVVAFMGALVPKLDRLTTFISKELADANTLDEVATKFQGTALNRRQRMSVAGLLASLGYQFTALEDGTDGYYLKGIVSPSNAIVGYALEPAVPSKVATPKA